MHAGESGQAIRTHVNSPAPSAWAASGANAVTAAAMPKTSRRDIDSDDMATGPARPEVWTTDIGGANAIREAATAQSIVAAVWHTEGEERE